MVDSGVGTIAEHKWLFWRATWDLAWISEQDEPPIPIYQLKEEDNVPFLLSCLPNQHLLSFTYILGKILALVFFPLDVMFTYWTPPELLLTCFSCCTNYIHNRLAQIDGSWFMWIPEGILCLLWSCAMYRQLLTGAHLICRLSKYHNLQIIGSLSCAGNFWKNTVICWLIPNEQP